MNVNGGCVHDSIYKTYSCNYFSVGFLKLYKSILLPQSMAYTDLEHLGGWGLDDGRHFPMRFTPYQLAASSGLEPKLAQIAALEERIELYPVGTAERNSLVSHVFDGYVEVAHQLFPLTLRDPGAIPAYDYYMIRAQRAIKRLGE